MCDNLIVPKRKRRLRILFSSNAPWCSHGYGTQSNLIGTRLFEAGFPLAYNAFAGLYGGVIKWRGIDCYPVLNHTFGSDGLWYNGAKHNADIAIPFHDSFTLNGEDLKRVKRLVFYSPIDRDPVPQPVLNAFTFAWRIITFSKWGQYTLRKAGYLSEMIPHGVDTKVMVQGNREQEKVNLKVKPSDFLFGMVAANKENPPRKSFQHVLDAFKIFHANHPDSYIYFHSWHDQPGGFPIVEYARFLGVGDFIRVRDNRDLQYVGFEEMSRLYSAMDCLLAPSTAEGFGLPVIEAQSCQTPVIVNNFSAQPELVEEGKTGFICDNGWLRYEQQGAYMGQPDPGSLLDKMEAVYKADRKAMGENARKKMIAEYDIDMLVEKKWIPYLENIENIIYGPENTPVAPQDAPKTPQEVKVDPVQEALAKTQETFGQEAVKVL